MKCIKHGGSSWDIGSCSKCVEEDLALKGKQVIPDATLETGTSGTIFDSPLDPTKGIKFDQDKLDWSLLPVDAAEEVIKVLMFGAKKYAPGNWKKVDKWDTRYYNAAMRHLTAWSSKESLDSETNLTHLAHAACCILFMISKEKEKNGNV